jgi:hypothetical protein
VQEGRLSARGGPGPPSVPLRSGKDPFRERRGVDRSGVGLHVDSYGLSLADGRDDHGAGVADVEVEAGAIGRRVLQSGLAVRALRDCERGGRAVLPAGQDEADEGTAGEVAVPVGRER